MTGQGAATGLADYSRCAQHAAGLVIREYSTSFGWASRLLGPRVRERVASIYALVRVADEIVDGPASQAGLPVTAQRELLDGLEAETCHACQAGYSANLVVHAFAQAARAAGIGPELTGPFFASMRRDLDPAPLDAQGLRVYIHGSAEVVGLMCLRVFLIGRETAPESRAVLEEGAARLGAAFQKVNFLRDIGADWNTLGRNYFPGAVAGRLSEVEKSRLLDDIDADLAAAAAAIPALPSDCRRAVAAAHGLFASLSRRLRATPADQLSAGRVSVPTAGKAGVILSAALRGAGGGTA